MEHISPEAPNNEASSSMPDQQPAEEGQFVVYRTGDGELTLPNGRVVTFEPAIWDFIEVSHQAEGESDVNVVSPEVIELDITVQQKLGAFAARVFAAATFPIIEAHSPMLKRRGTTYTFNPKVQLIDLREQVRNINHPIERIRHTGLFKDMYKSETREALFKRFLDEYIGHEQIYKKLKQLHHRYVVPKFDLEGSIVIDEPPEADETKKYLLQLEIGIVAFFEEQDTALAEHAILNMIEAYYNLLFKHTCLIKKHANHYRQDTITYHELCHEGHVGLLNLIIDYLAYRTYIPEENIEEEGEVEQVRSQFLNDANGSTFADIAEYEIIRAMRRYMQQRRQPFELYEKPANPGFKPKKNLFKVQTQTSAEGQYEPDDFDKLLENAMLQDEVAELLQANILTEREKIVLSLHFGLFIESLRGAKFKPDQFETFKYPESEAEMPPNALTERQISDLLGVRLNSVKAILHVALKACRKHIESQGFETLDELLP